MNLRVFQQHLARSLPECVKSNRLSLCAVSGGIDSVVMLHALRSISKREDMSLCVAHVDHGLRSDSGEVAKWVAGLAKQLGLPFCLQRVRVPALVRRGGVTVEEAARNARYAALERKARENAAVSVIVAHHADDQAETVLHHILRGTGLTGLSGMPAVRPIRDGSPIMLIRPMLGFTRGEIEAYAAAVGLEHREDSTNRDTRMTRNWLRHQLMPLLREQFNPRVVEALARLADQARNAMDVVNAAAREVFERARIENTGKLVCLDVSELTLVPTAVRREVLRSVLKMVGAPMQSLDHERVAAVDSLTQGNGRRRLVELPGGFAAQRRGKYMLLGPAAAIYAWTSRPVPPAVSPNRTRRAGRGVR